MAVNSGSFLVSDLINEALGHLGVYTGDALSAADMQSAFTTFLLLMDGWAAEPLTIFERGEALTFTTIAGEASYSLGVTSSNPSAPQPLWSVSALPANYDAITQGPAGTGLELPVKVAGEYEYVHLPLKGLQSSILEKCWIQTQASSHVLNFWPTPSAAIPINLYTSQRIPAFSAISNSFTLPPGYMEALVFELAAKLSAKFGASLPEWLPTALSDAKSKIKAANWPALESRCDRDLVRRSARLGGDQLAFYEGR